MLLEHVKFALASERETRLIHRARGEEGQWEGTKGNV